MDTQQHSWLDSFGVTKAPIVEPKASKIKRHGNCFVEDKHKETRRLKQDILEKLKEGMAGCNNIFKALLEEEKIPAKDGKTMTIDVFREHYAYSERSINNGAIRIPRGEKQKKIVSLFDSGVSEADIYRIHGFDKSHIYSTLIMFQRIKKRDRSHRINTGSVNVRKITDLIKSGYNNFFIAKKTGSTIKYVKQVRLARKRAITLFEQGKSVDEICVLVKISKAHAEYLEKGLNNGLSQ